jgi:hypothetical protein
MVETCDRGLETRVHRKQCVTANQRRAARTTRPRGAARARDPKAAPMAGVAENASEGVQLISVSISPQQEEEGEPQETKAAPTANGGGGGDDAAAVEKARRRKLKEHMKPDENAMTVGILNIMFTAFTVGRWPQSFFLLHLVKTTVLLPWRYIRFRKRKWQWYLIEFCYFVSYATLICCFLALLRTSTGYESPLTEYNDIFFRVGFSFATGPLVSAHAHPPSC